MTGRGTCWGWGYEPDRRGLEPAIHPRTPLPLRPLAVLLCLALAGCHEYDTYNRPGVWHPDDANVANIAAMASRPADLIRGHGAGESDGRAAVGAIDRLWPDSLPTATGPTGSPTGPTAGKGFAAPLGTGAKSGTP